MINKTLSIGFILSLVLFLFPSPVYGSEKSSGSSAVLTREQGSPIPDTRVKILKKFLLSYNSPLATSANTFVAEADKNKLDWRLVASISGVESTFAHHLPYESYNAWGWGIYGDNMLYFKSYDNGIETISQSLREKYMDTWGARDVYQIGRYYASSPTWAQRVEYFMNRIEYFAMQNQTDTLSISL